MATELGQSFFPKELSAMLGCCRNFYLLEMAPPSHHHTKRLHKAAFREIAIAENNHAKLHPSECNISAPQSIPPGLDEIIPPPRATNACPSDNAIWALCTFAAVLPAMETLC